MLSLMAQPDCPHCGGTGWRLVDRVDANQKAERVVERKDARPGADRRIAKVHAGPCPATAPAATAPLVRLIRARIPRRYEHCDFENFDTDLWEGSARSSRLEPQPGAGHACWWKASRATIPPAAKPAFC